MSQNVTLNVQTRVQGKAQSSALRRSKTIPAVVYGPQLGKKNLNLSVDQLSVERYSASKFDNAIFKLNSDDSDLNGLSVLMKNVDVHPVSRQPVHVDFFALDLSSRIKVNVEVKYEGKPKGLQDGGLFQVLLRQIEIEAPATSIPESLTADISDLGLNDTLHISDLNLPDGTKSTSENDLALASVIKEGGGSDEPAAEEAAAAPAEEAKS